MKDDELTLHFATMIINAVVRRSMDGLQMDSYILHILLENLHKSGC